jgi:hypothetical protein
MKIRFYGTRAVDQPPIKVAVCVSPAGFSDDDDEASTVAVDSATASLALQSKLPGHPPAICLIYSNNAFVLHLRASFLERRRQRKRILLFVQD